MAETKDDYKKWKGWVIARRLYDDDGSLKWFTFYPNKENGKPSHFYRTKMEAEKAYEEKNKSWLPFDKETKVMRYKPEMYLNRY